MKDEKNMTEATLAAENEATIEEAARVVEQARVLRTQKCSVALKQVLDAHGCKLEPVVTIRGNQIFSQIVVASRE